MPKITYDEPTARRIQNYGEQHPDFHNAEMKRWRARWHRASSVRVFTRDRVDTFLAEWDAATDPDLFNWMEDAITLLTQARDALE